MPLMSDSNKKLCKLVSEILALVDKTKQSIHVILQHQ